MTGLDGEVLTEVRRIFAAEIGSRREIGPNDDLTRDLSLDSLSLLTLVVGLENRFRIVLREEDAPAVRTVADLVALVVRRVHDSAAEQGPST